MEVKFMKEIFTTDDPKESFEASLNEDIFDSVELWDFSGFC